MYVEYSNGIDLLALIGFFALCIPFLSWYLVSRKQYFLLKEATLRCQILATRCCLFLPIYAFLIWLSLTAPTIETACEIPIAIVEAYSFYNFLAMVTNYLGGANRCAELINQLYHAPCGCCYADPYKFYNSLLRSLWYCLWVRPVVVLITVIAHYSHIEWLYVLTTVAGLVILVWTFLSLVTYFHALMEPCTNLQGNLSKGHHPFMRCEVSLIADATICCTEIDPVLTKCSCSLYFTQLVIDKMTKPLITRCIEAFVGQDEYWVSSCSGYNSDDSRSYWRLKVVHYKL